MKSNNKSTGAYSLGEVGSFGERKKRALIRYVFDCFLDHLPEASSILEIGPGRGEFAEEAIQRGYKYYGIEPSTSLSEELEKKNINVFNKSVPPIDFPDDYFDMVYSFDVVEHFQGYSEAFRFIEESMRVMKEGALICIIAPNYTTLRSLFFEYEYQHSFVTTMGRMEKMFNDAGLSVTHKADFLIKPNKGFYSVFDRMLAYTMLPFARSNVIAAMFRICRQEKLLYKIRKNLFDHILIIGQKNSKD